jgi:hypothetical protein
MSSLTEDPIVTELERLSALLTVPCSFMHADLYEANFGLDKLDKRSEFPVMLYITTGTERDTIMETNLTIREVPISLMMLNTLPKATTDYSSKEVDPDINLMRLNAMNLIHLVNKSELTFVGEPVTEFEVSKIYAKFDRHLFGVAVDFTWSVNTNSSGC